MLHDDNLTIERPTFVTHLQCAQAGDRYPADQAHNLSRAGKPLLVHYDLDGIRKALSKESTFASSVRSVAVPRTSAGAPPAGYCEPG